MAEAAAEFRHVTKDYSLGPLGLSKRRALTDVTLTIDAGQVFGLLGPNRAGKTTLVKLLLTLCRPTSGEVRRLGQPVIDRSTLVRVGYVHENHAFPRYLTPAELLQYYGALTRISVETLENRVPKLLTRVGLADRANDAIRTFSKGMTQRLGIAQALVNEPDLLVLDEPNEGLDLEGRQLMAGIIHETRERGGTVILVSHVLPEVEKFCDRVAVIVAGRLAFTGPTSELTHRGARSLEAALAELYGAPTA
ncbi:MAG: ABC transporter ATP-binding protein [Gemmataceae bacterium]